MGANFDRSSDRALRFVLFLGVVSLFADMTYEGARSIVGPYLGTLGAGAVIVALPLLTLAHRRTG